MSIKKMQKLTPLCKCEINSEKSEEVDILFEKYKKQSLSEKSSLKTEEEYLFNAFCMGDNNECCDECCSGDLCKCSLSDCLETMCCAAFL